MEQKRAWKAEAGSELFKRAGSNKLYSYRWGVEGEAAGFALQRRETANSRQTDNRAMGVGGDVKYTKRISRCLVPEGRGGRKWADLEGCCDKREVEL
jgi:hypothetical protein